MNECVFVCAGGPLELGDIEDVGNGKLALICPWHHFDFCLDTGSSSTGLQVSLGAMEAGLVMDQENSNTLLCYTLEIIL